MLICICSLLTALVLMTATLDSPAFAQDLLVEKKTFELPRYETVAGDTIKNVRIVWGGARTAKWRQIDRRPDRALLLRQLACFRQVCRQRFRRRLLGRDYRSRQADRYQQILRDLV